MLEMYGMPLWLARLQEEAHTNRWDEVVTTAGPPFVSSFTGVRDPRGRGNADIRRVLVETEDPDRSFHEERVRLDHYRSLQLHMIGQELWRMETAEIRPAAPKRPPPVPPHERQSLYHIGAASSLRRDLDRVEDGTVLYSVSSDFSWQGRPIMFMWRRDGVDGV